MKLPLKAVWRAVNDCLPKDKRFGSPNTIGNYEARNDPSVRFLVALKEAYPDDLPLEWLMFGDKGTPGHAPPGPPPPPLTKRKLGKRYFSRWKLFGDAGGIIDRFLRRLTLFYPDTYLSRNPFELAISDPKAPICELDKWLEKWALSPFKQLPGHFIKIEELTHAEAVTYCHAILAVLGPLLRSVREDKRPARSALPPSFAALLADLRFKEFREHLRRNL